MENRYAYDAFGNLLGQEEAFPNRILYAGQLYDQKTDQYYLRARYYNPTIGRFSQEDTYWGDGLNLYAYCANNPVRYFDPSGHQKKPNCPGTEGEAATDKQPGVEIESGINSYADFSKAISDIGMRSDLTDAQKISELQKLFESSNYKADINVPSDIQYVKGFDAKGNVIYDWPPKLGFDESTIKSISRTDSLPDTWDRYGYMGGSNFADVPPTGKYTYSERAIPYVENEAAYHTGAFNNATYFDKIDAIKNGDIDGLNTILSREGIANVDSSYFKNLQNTYNDFIEDTANAVGSNIDATYGLKGTAASWGDMSGGAGQYVTPLNGSTMKRLGIIN